MSEIKFTEEELKEVKEIRNNYGMIQNNLGSLGMVKLKLINQLNAINQQEEALAKNHDETQQKAQKFLEEINKKYGEGRLDIESGVFKKNK